MTNFEKALIEEVKRVRERLAEADQSRMCFSIEADGRVHDGELRITFKLGEYGGDVSGNSVDAVLTEYLRRKGWNQRHAPLEIGYDGKAEAESASTSVNFLKEPIKTDDEEISF